MAKRNKKSSRKSTRSMPAITPEDRRATVESVCQQIEDARIFNVFNTSLLERVAWVESSHGFDEGDPAGGIWRVRRELFFNTQMPDCHPYLSGYIHRIRKAFDIEWIYIKWEQIQQPLYSALAAGLLMSMSSVGMYSLNKPVGSTVEAQAKFWRECYVSTEQAKWKWAEKLDQFIFKVSKNENKKGFIPFVNRLHTKDSVPTTSKTASKMKERTTRSKATPVDERSTRSTRPRMTSSPYQHEAKARRAAREIMPATSAVKSPRAPTTDSYPAPTASKAATKAASKVKERTRSKPTLVDEGSTRSTRMTSSTSKFTTAIAGLSESKPVKTKMPPSKTSRSGNAEMMENKSQDLQKSRKEKREMPVPSTSKSHQKKPAEISGSHRGGTSSSNKQRNANPDSMNYSLLAMAFQQKNKKHHATSFKGEKIREPSITKPRNAVTGSSFKQDQKSVHHSSPGTVKQDSGNSVYENVPFAATEKSAAPGMNDAELDSDQEVSVVNWSAGSGDEAVSNDDRSDSFEGSTNVSSDDHIYENIGEQNKNVSDSEENHGGSSNSFEESDEHIYENVDENASDSEEDHGGSSDSFEESDYSDEHIYDSIDEQSGSDSEENHDGHSDSNAVSSEAVLDASSNSSEGSDCSDEHIYNDSIDEQSGSDSEENHDGHSDSNSVSSEAVLDDSSNSFEGSDCSDEPIYENIGEQDEKVSRDSDSESAGNHEELKSSDSFEGSDYSDEPIYENIGDSQQQ